MPKISIPDDSVAAEQCRRALLEVMKVWPDSEVSRQAVTERACSFVHVDGCQGRMARITVLELIEQCCPRFTIDRSRRFWKILFVFFGRDDALGLYAAQCPATMTAKALTAVRNHLLKQGYTMCQISAALNGKGKKPPPKR